MWYEDDIDAKMTRTANRPIPRGRITRPEALTFGMTLAFFSVVTLGILVNWVAAALLAFTIFFYVVIYTIWLKRTTAQNIVIGGAAGALPPVVAWAAVTGSLAVEPLLLFAIIFFWTPPHFWALALFRADDYANAGVPMLPVIGRPRRTRGCRSCSTPSCWSRSPSRRGRSAISARSTASPRWRSAAACCGCALRVYRQRSGSAALRAARNLFRFSILYLFALFAVLLLEVVARRRAGACSAEEVCDGHSTPHPTRIDGIVLTPAQKKSQRERSIAIALALFVLVILFFAVTMVKGPGVLVRPM